jgi:hypothetical protein
MLIELDDEHAAVLEMLLAQPRWSERAAAVTSNDPERVFAAVAEAFDEYREALVAGRADLQIEQLYELAAAAVKGLARLTG